MANTNIPLVPIGTLLSSSNNSFVSGWGDKRSGTTVGVSLVFYGSNAADGYAWLEVSNAVDQPGAIISYPINQGDDVAELASSQQSVTKSSLTQLYGTQWLIANCPARWVRVRYVATVSVSGLSANVYMNVPHESV